MRLDTRSMIVISAAVVLNVLASATIMLLKIPLYLDSIGTVLVAVLAGPVAGAIAGGLSVLIGGITTNPLAIPFIPVGMMIGFVAGWLARLGGFRTWWLALLSGALIAIPTTILAVPIIVFLFGGVSGAGADFGAAYLLAVGTTLLKSVGIANLSSSVADKALTGWLAFTVAHRLPLRLLTSFRFYSHSRAS